MKMKNKIVAGNWKMNKTFSDAEDLIVEIAEGVEDISENVEVLLFPPFVYIEMATDIEQEANVMIGAQNVSEFESGAYTGEVSAQMLESLGVHFCLIGHSERRKYFNESNETLAKKVNSALKYNISPIFCIGETLEERTADKHFAVIEQQLNESLFHLSQKEFEEVIIAYEPVWAIGTGVTASVGQAQEMHAYIRGLVAKKYHQTIADECFILYGGSCNADNAVDLFSLPDVDGGLIGGASLSAEQFLKIVDAAESVTASK
jgi:triosephosphate isomerase (TIM)